LQWLIHDTYRPMGFTVLAYLKARFCSSVSSALPRLDVTFSRLRFAERYRQAEVPVAGAPGRLERVPYLLC
jgi:hypothetical protein